MKEWFTLRKPSKMTISDVNNYYRMRTISIVIGEWFQQSQIEQEMFDKSVKLYKVNQILSLFNQWKEVTHQQKSNQTIALSHFNQLYQRSFRHLFLSWRCRAMYRSFICHLREMLNERISGVHWRLWRKEYLKAKGNKYLNKLSYQIQIQIFIYWQSLCKECQISKRFELLLQQRNFQFLFCEWRRRYSHRKQKHLQFAAANRGYELKLMKSALNHWISYYYLLKEKVINVSSAISKHTMLMSFTEWRRVSVETSNFIIQCHQWLTVKYSLFFWRSVNVDHSSRLKEIQTAVVVNQMNLISSAFTDWLFAQSQIRLERLMIARYNHSLVEESYLMWERNLLEMRLENAYYEKATVLFVQSIVRYVLQQWKEFVSDQRSERIHFSNIKNRLELTYQRHFFFQWHQVVDTSFAERVLKHDAFKQWLNLHCQLYQLRKVIRFSDQKNAQRLTHAFREWKIKTVKVKELERAAVPFALEVNVKHLHSVFRQWHNSTQKLMNKQTTLIEQSKQSQSSRLLRYSFIEWQQTATEMHKSDRQNVERADEFANQNLMIHTIVRWFQRVKYKQSFKLTISTFFNKLDSVFDNYSYQLLVRYFGIWIVHMKCTKWRRNTSNQQLSNMRMSALQAIQQKLKVFDHMTRTRNTPVGSLTLTPRQSIESLISGDESLMRRGSSPIQSFNFAQRLKLKKQFEST